MSLRRAINGRYEVDDTGNVYSLTRRVRCVDRLGLERYRLLVGRRLAQQSDSRGYPMISLDGKRYRVHRLIATAFIPNPAALSDVNHKDGDKRNCAASNLEWISRTGNIRHALDTGLRVPKTSVTDLQIIAAEQLIAAGASQTRAAKAVGISQAYLSMIRTGRYRLKYALRSNTPITANRMANSGLYATELTEAATPLAGEAV
jgi:hypothetical protein